MVDIEGYCWNTALHHALEANRGEAHSRYFQLATIALDGTPKNRTVVFRGFGQSRDALLAITDRRSNKVAELAQFPQTEVCWYFPVTREQFRLTANVQLLHADTEHAAAREAVWHGLSDASKAQFYWRHPGLQYVAPNQAADAQPVMSTMPPDTFTVLSIEPSKVDHLTLGSPQVRRISTCADLGEDPRWQVYRVNP